MPEKIFDIIPPKGNLPQERKIKKKDIEFNFKKYLFYFFLSLFLFSGIWAYFSLSYAEIEIWLETETITLEETVTVDLNIDYIDTLERYLPGKLFFGKASSSQNFSATGKTEVEERAKGIIRVYNNHSAEPQPLVAQTRFVSSDGKLFRSVKREVVPGRRYESGKLEPGYVDIEVVAAESGEEYNIGSSAFSIPGFAGTAKYVDFYGKSFSSMEGGFKGEGIVVLKEDIERARKIIKEHVLRESFNLAFEEAMIEDFFIPKEDSVFKKEILEERCSVKEGEMAETFNCEIGVSVDFLGFREKNIQVLGENLINRNIEENNKIKENSLEISYNIEQIEEEGKIILNAIYKAEIYFDINIIEFQNIVIGREKEEIRKQLSEMPQVRRVQINSWPLFNKRASEDKEKVKIIINI